MDRLKRRKTLIAGGCWGSYWSASNEDTTMLPVIWIGDAQSTPAFLVFGKVLVSFLIMESCTA